MWTGNKFNRSIFSSNVLCFWKTPNIQNSSPNIIIEAWTGNMMKYLFQTEMAKKIHFANLAKILFPSRPLLTCLLELSMPDTFNSLSESKPTKPHTVTPHICYVTLPSFESSSIRTYQQLELDRKKMSLTATSIFIKIFTAKDKCRHCSKSKNPP